MLTQPPTTVHSVEIAVQNTDSQVTKHGHLNKKENNVTGSFLPQSGVLQAFNLS